MATVDAPGDKFSARARNLAALHSSISASKSLSVFGRGERGLPPAKSRGTDEAREATMSRPGFCKGVVEVEVESEHKSMENNR